jgi:hypothetical protein
MQVPVDVTGPDRLFEVDPRPKMVIVHAQPDALRSLRVLCYRGRT